ncbi:MAG: CpXC domain-containing protein [Lachnospiraceae bacterium]|nr:CpXC domain-containing protein [Lachnospiraceae bacterium]MDE7202382.1 CpXC domain-containing protein [Lachnospiraceae bacterium]
MNKLHMTKNPWAAAQTTVQCQHCNNVFPAQRINCIDTLLWPEGRQILDEGAFFHPVCPQCQTQAEISYPSRYIDREYGIAAVLVPGIESQNPDQLLPHMNRFLARLALDGMEHRAVGNFHAMAEQMRIHQYGLNDKAIQLLKPIIIGSLQAKGFEVWNGFFMDLLHPEGAEQMDDTIYMSTQEDAKDAYTEDVYQFYIYLTNGDIIPRGINDTAYQLCMNILQDKELADDDGLFHLYDLSWAINIHNSLYPN